MSNSLLAKQIVVTGSIGSGKSRVSRYLAELLHLPYINVDDLARRLMEKGGDGLRAVKKYNPVFINSDGSLNRSLLRQEIFKSAIVKKDIDSFMHPMIQASLLADLKLESNTVIEIPLLFETDWDSLFNTVIVVYASKDNCLQRIVRRDTVSVIDAERAYNSQMDISIKKAKATFVINNDKTWLETIENIKNVTSKLIV